MTKAELIASVAKDAGTTVSVAEKIVNSTFETIATAMAAKQEVEIPKFGKFGRKFRDARKGRNPATGGTIDIAAKGAPHFSPSSVLKKALA
jgi:DNA-binding protein HU-beta